MRNLLEFVEIKVNDSLFVKNPLSTVLGKKIIKYSSTMINDLGFDAFTFKKLGLALKTNESSIYRYFNNKHNLLIYLLSWYWGYMEYLLVFSCTNISNPEEKLKAAVNTLCAPVIIPDNNDFIDEESLNGIVIAESSKTYLTKYVEEENKEGFFLAFKRPCRRLADIILEINPNYRYAHSLATIVVEGIMMQKYFNLHLSTLTDFNKQHEGINTFYNDLVIKTIKN